MTSYRLGLIFGAVIGIIIGIYVLNSITDVNGPRSSSTCQPEIRYCDMRDWQKCGPGYDCVSNGGDLATCIPQKGFIVVSENREPSLWDRFKPLDRGLLACVGGLVLLLILRRIRWIRNWVNVLRLEPDIRRLYKIGEARRKLDEEEQKITARHDKNRRFYA